MDWIWTSMALARMAIGHALADGLQGELSGLKRRRGPDGATKKLQHWLPYLALHSAAHGLGVGWALGSVWAALAEALCHGLIDFGKCERVYGAWVDQALHLGCKIAWLAIFFM
jgi:GNAT superfamily N-acetyltransferase